MLLTVNALTLLYLIMGIVAQLVTTLISIVISYPGGTVILVVILILPIIRLTSIELVNPSHPPFRVCFLFRQVRKSLGINETVSEVLTTTNKVNWSKAIAEIAFAVNQSKGKL